MYFFSTVTSSSALNKYEPLAKYEFRAARHSSKRERVHKKYIYHKIYLHSYSSLENINKQVVTKTPPTNIKYKSSLANLLKFP